MLGFMFRKTTDAGMHSQETRRRGRTSFDGGKVMGGDARATLLSHDAMGSGLVDQRSGWETRPLLQICWRSV